MHQVSVKQFEEHMLTCLSVCTAFAMVPELKNVRINSVNFRSKLQWDPPTFHKGNITYTVQHKR